MYRMNLIIVAVNIWEVTDRRELIIVANELRHYKNTSKFQPTVYKNISGSFKRNSNLILLFGLS